jgi:FkbM family methyltransferase
MGGNGRHVRFVQVGAFDGSDDRFGNYLLEDLVKECGWRGLFVEPQPEPFARLKERYEGVPDLIFENVAIGSPGTRKMWRTKLQPHMNTNMQTNASFHKSSALICPIVGSHGEDLRRSKDTLEQIEVKSSSLRRVLKKNKLENFDVFLVDAEGDDFSILIELSHTEYRPSFIRYEYVHYSRDQRLEIAGLLENLGYSFWMERKMDSLFYWEENKFKDFF